MTPESRSARPATGTAAETMARRMATENGAGEDSVVVEVADEVVAEDVAAVVLEVVEATVRMVTTTTDMAEAETVTVEVETDMGTTIRMVGRMATRTEIVEVSEAEVVEAGVDEEAVGEAEVVTLEVVTTETKVVSDEEAVAVVSGLVKTTTTTKTERSRSTSPGSCTFPLRRPKTRMKSSALASAPASTLINSTTSRST